MAARAEDDGAALELCRRGMTFAVASESELAELRSALEPVYAELTADPETRSAIDAITDLKAEVAASAEAPACTSTEPPATASPIPDGTYETTLAKADWADERRLAEGRGLRGGGSVAGVYKMIFDAGESTFSGRTATARRGATPCSATRSRPRSPRLHDHRPLVAGRRRSRSQTSTAPEAMQKPRP